MPLSRIPGGSNAFKRILPVPARVPERLEQRTREGHEWIYVLIGTLRLALGDQGFRPHAGEAAAFDTRTPHGMANVGSRPVELLIIFSLQGERVHMRARTK